MEGKEELLISQDCVGFGFEITNETAGETIFSNQVQFGDRFFEILGHGGTLEGLKDIWGGVFNTDKIKIHYFKMIERAYKIDTPEGFQRVIKYQILEILD